MSKRTILVSGRGTIHAAPDQAIVNLSIEKRGPDQTKAQDDVNRIVNRFLECCQKLEIPLQQIHSAHLDVHPEYHWDKEKERQRLIGFIVRRAIEIKLDNLEIIGSVLEQATECGVNQTNGPVFTIKDKDHVYRQALVVAANNARLNAQTAAEALDAKVGKVRKIKTVQNSRPGQPRGKMRMMQASGGESSGETYHIGEIKVHAEINASFELIET